MQVIITRPEADAIRTARKVADLGFVPVIAPLAQVRLHQPTIPARTFDGIIITSRHALQAISGPYLATHRATPVYCVGQATSKMAKQAGFQAITSAATVEDLIGLVIGHAAPEQSWLYLAGEPRKNAIELELSDKVRLEVCISYHIEELDYFPDDALAKLTDQHPVWLHYSDKSAERAARLITRSPKASLFVTARHLVLSASIGQTVKNMGGSDITVAQRPDQSAMLAALLTMRQD